MTNQEELERRYVDGWYAGRADAFELRVRTGQCLAAEMSCHAYVVESVIASATQAGLLAFTSPEPEGRVTVWVYRDRRVRALIEAIDAMPQGIAAWWAMGKLFGYSDADVIDFIAKRSQKDRSDGLNVAPETPTDPQEMK